jgi:tRNA A37 threonylcarbamoyladenosine synthetase subunit TsaC/SUA5/YrdC
VATKKAIRKLRKAKKLEPTKPLSLHQKTAGDQD